MKRYGNLFKEVYAMKNLELAYKHAKKGKGWYREVKVIEENPSQYLLEIQRLLKTNSYKTSPYKTFLKNDTGKEREIYKLPFYPDRICQWAILQIIEPQLVATFTSDTYSAIPNRGIHDAFRKLRKSVDTSPHEMEYCLKLDCRKFYPSIDHEILKAKFKRKYKDGELLHLIYEIIDSINTCPATKENLLYYMDKGRCVTTICDKRGNEFIKGIGIPIGNYFSQYGGNFYLSEFDHWIKETKRVKHYYRYMDDICIFLDSKEELGRLFLDIRSYLDRNLNLRVKGNYQIFPSFVRGVDFVGYRIFDNYTLLRKSTCKRFKRKMIAIRKKVRHGEDMNYSDWCAINSYMGWLKYCDSYRLYEKYIQPIKCYADEYYLKNIKSKERR